MPLILSGNVATATAATGYDVANSVRYNDGDSPKLDLDFSSDGTLNKWTFSMWFKRSTLGTAQRLFCCYDSGMDDYIKFGTDDQLEWVFDNEDGSNKGVLKTNRKFRDVSAWYHLVCRLDTTDGTAGDRMRMYINGTEETSFATDTNPTQNETGDIGRDNDHFIGTFGSGQYFDGYMAEVCMINNQSLAPTSFGEYDEDSPTIWKPIDVSGLTAGTNGFYLDFEDSGNLGNDAFGGTDWTETNLAATDQTSDTCTNNFATWNSLINSNGSTAQANASYTTSNSSSNYGYRLSTIGMSSGKWYAEVKYASSSNQALIGIRSREATAVVHYLGYYDDDYAIYVDGHYYNNNSETTNSNASWTNGDIIGIFLDLDNNKLYFSKNGSLYSSTGISITAAVSTTTGFYFFSVSEWNSSGNGTFELNTGNPSFSLTSAVNDGEYGSFEYTTTITGDGASKTFKALNTKNLAEYGG